MNRDPRRKTRFNYLIQTDASVRGEKSMHSYNIRGLKNDGSGGKQFRNKSFARLFDDSMMAEMYALTEALQFMQERGFNRSVVLTDCQNVVEWVRNRQNNYEDHRFHREIIHLRKLLDRTHSIIRYQKRENNKGADAACHAAWNRKQFSIKGKEVKGFKSQSYKKYEQRKKVEQQIKALRRKKATKKKSS